MTTIKYDPRVKFLVALTLSTIGVLSGDLMTSLFNLAIGMLYSFWFGVNLWQIIKKMRRLLLMFFGLIVIQSLFTRSGVPIISIGRLTLLTDYGLILGLNYLMRVLIIMLSGAIISTSSMRDSIQGMCQLGLPYEIGFMSALGIRFLPLLVEEVGNTYTSMELRGINIKALKLGQRMEIMSQLFVPVIYSTTVRAKALAESAVARGFVVGASRSSYLTLRFKKHDYGMIVIVLIFFMATLVSLNR